MRDAQRDRDDEEPALIAVELLDIEKSRAPQAQRSGLKVIDLTSLGSEVGEADHAGHPRDVRLPVGAEMALAGLDRERKIGIVMIGADPRAIKSDLRGDAASDAVYGPDILDHIDERLARLGLPDGVQGVVVFDIEVHAFRSAGSLSGGDGGRILGKGGDGKED